MKGISFKAVGVYLWKPLAMLAIIYIVIATLPNKNIVSITLAVIIPVLLLKLLKEKPIFKNWVKTTLSISLGVVAFFLLFKFLGSLGLIGLTIIILVLVAWRIWKGRKLFFYTINWGSEALHGRKKDFDISNLEPDHIVNNDKEE